MNLGKNQGDIGLQLKHQSWIPNVLQQTEGERQTEWLWRVGLQCHSGETERYPRRGIQAEM